MPYEWVKRIEGAPDQTGALFRGGPSQGNPSQESSSQGHPSQGGTSHPGTGPVAELHLWPYRSLPRRGFVLVIGVTSAMLTLPLVQVLGTPILWGLLPFIVIVVAALWYALNRSYRDGEIIEILRYRPDQITLSRRTAGKSADWQANPHWVKVTLYDSGGPIPKYLTLKGNGREVELGSFLSEEERIALFHDLQELLEK